MLYVLTHVHTLHVGRFSSVGMATRCGLDGPSSLRRGAKAHRLLGLRVRIPPGAWMFVLCVVSEDKKIKCTTIKTKKQEWIKQEQRTKKVPSGEMYSAPVHTRLLCTGCRVCFPGVKRPRRVVNPHPYLTLSLKNLSGRVLGRTLPFVYCANEVEFVVLNMAIHVAAAASR
jgi:hypothetical protein